MAEMKAEILRKHTVHFEKHFPSVFPAMGWYFSTTQVNDSVTFESDTWECMFTRLDSVISGRPLCFSKEASGCSGASCYLGFKDPNEKSGYFLAEKEKFKEKAEYGIEFYKTIKAETPLKKYLILQKLEDIPHGIEVEVINLWVSPLVLSGLITLSNFDSASNDNVSIPFASGCQSMWTLPYKEKFKDKPKSIIGAMDPAMRTYIPDDTLLFSVPPERYITLAKNITNSFAGGQNWIQLIKSEHVNDKSPQFKKLD